MFDAWTDKQTVDAVKWDGSVVSFPNINCPTPPYPYCYREERAVRAKVLALLAVC